MPKRTPPPEKKILSSSSAIVSPRQPKLRKTVPKRTAPVPRVSKKPEATTKALSRAKLEKDLERIQTIEIRAEAAAATGLLPHEWLLAVMRGEQLNHFAYDQETHEIVEVIVLPTFQDRVDCAKAAAPYYAEKLQNPKTQGGKGRNIDPMKPPGVMEVPLAASMEQWINVASASQAKLKRDVVK